MLEVRKLELIKSTTIIGIGKISTQFLNFFLLPLYTAILSTEEYGYVDVINVISSVLVVIVNLQLEQGLFRFLIGVSKKEEKEEVISAAFMINAVVFIVYIVIYAMINFVFLYDIKIGIGYLLFCTISTIYYNNMMQISRGMGDNKLYAFGGFLSSALIIMFNIIFLVFLDMKAEGMLLANILGFTFTGLYLTKKQKVYKYLHIKSISKECIYKLLSYCIPLVPNELAWKIINSSDRIVTSVALGIATNGILAIACKITSFFIMFFHIFNTSWYEFVILHYTDKDREELLSSIINSAMNIFGSVSLLIICFIEKFFIYIVDEKFYDAYYQIPLFMIANLFNIGMGLISVVYIAEKDTKAIAKSSCTCAIVNLVVCILLINKFGLYAASISSIVAYAAVFFSRYIDIRKYLNLSFKLSNIVLLWVSFLSISIFYYIKKINIFIVGIIILEIVFINRNDIRKVLNIIKAKLK